MSSTAPDAHADHLVLFSAAPAKGKWVSLISRLLNNESPRTALSEERYNDELQSLCDDATATMSSEPVALTIDVKDDDRLVLVGDIHGQFRDLQTHILSVQQRAIQNGEKDYKFLFLGDYVDRGPHGVEVMILLLALKVEFPSQVFILRGNHEEAQTCRIYGFMQECRAKLDVECWSKFVEVFRQLPMAAVVTCPSGSFFCTHGGLSPHTTAIEGLQFLNRVEYGDHYNSIETNDAETMDGLLWSDPSETSGYRQNYRGCGFTFGPDATEDFCKQNLMQFVCRAHQMVMPGYRWDHADRLLTLFSAPNYCGMNDNKGAIAILEASKQVGKERVELEFVVYDAAPSSPSTIYGAAAGSPSSGIIADYFSPASPGVELAADPLPTTLAPASES